MKNITTKITLLFLILIAVSCTVITREIKYWDADITDYQIFPAYKFTPNTKTRPFAKADKPLNFTITEKTEKDTTKINLTDLLSKTTTKSFVVIHNDTIVYEYYDKDFSASQKSMLFSVSKSVTSLLVGIAIDEGYIKSIKDPITKYLPEFRDKDERFKRLTIEHLLNMRSGLKFNESYSNPLCKMATLYYGTNQYKKLQRLKFSCEPNSKHEYQSAATALLGMIIEKTTKRTLADYFNEKVWIPLGMEHEGSWALDDKRNRSTKSYCGLTLSALDLAKIGRLYLNNGKCGKQQVVSADWIKASLTPNIKNNNYQYQWYSEWYTMIESGKKLMKDSLSAVQLWKEKYAKRYPFYDVVKSYDNDGYYLHTYGDQFSALGIMKQILFIDRSQNLIIVRLGATGDRDYYPTMYDIAKYFRLKNRTKK